MALCDQLQKQLSQADQQRGRLLEAVVGAGLGSATAQDVGDPGLDVSQAMAKEISGQKDDSGDWRFIPYIQCHEFKFFCSPFAIVCTIFALPKTSGLTWQGCKA